MALQIHFFRVGRPHRIPGIIRTDAFPVSGLIITHDEMVDVGHDVYIRSQQMADYILPRIKAARTDRYIKPATMFALDEEDREATGKMAHLALPEPALAHINPAEACQACTEALMAEYAYLKRAEMTQRVQEHWLRMAGLQDAYAQIALDPEMVGMLQLHLNREFHGLPATDTY